MVNGSISYVPGIEQLNDLPGVVQMSDIYRVSVTRQAAGAHEGEVGGKRPVLRYLNASLNGPSARDPAQFAAVAVSGRLARRGPGDAHLYFNFHSPRRIEVTEDMAYSSESPNPSVQFMCTRPRGHGLLHHFADDRCVYQFEPDTPQAGRAADGSLGMLRELL